MRIVRGIPTISVNRKLSKSRPLAFQGLGINSAQSAAERLRRPSAFFPLPFVDADVEVSMLKLNQKIAFVLCLAVLPACSNAKFTGKSKKKDNSGPVAPAPEIPKSGSPDSGNTDPNANGGTTTDPTNGGTTNGGTTNGGTPNNTEDPGTFLPCNVNDAQCIDVCSKNPVECQVPCTDTRKTMCIPTSNGCDDPNQNDPTQNDNPSQHKKSCDNPTQH